VDSTSASGPLGIDAASLNPEAAHLQGFLKLRHYQIALDNVCYVNQTKPRPEPSPLGTAKPSRAPTQSSRHSGVPHTQTTVVASKAMLWPMLITLALVKLVGASMMLWLPFRTDSAVVAVDDPPRSDSGEDGGSKVCSDDPSDPHPHPHPHPHHPRPRRPRRGPHGGSPSPGAPRRVRTGTAHLRADTRHLPAD
jgi:hypothetical protein